MEPYYTMMKLPGETDAEFIQMLPFTPRRRDNLASWMVARSDGEHYGKLQVFQFPKQTLVFGPQQVVARINQDQVISPQITLWSQQGSQVIQGTLMVIPIEQSLIYVRPLYLPGAGRTHPGTDPRHRRLSEPHRHGTHAGRGDCQAVWRQRPTGRGNAVPGLDDRRGATGAAPPPSPTAHARMGAHRWRSPRDVPARARRAARRRLGEDTAKRSSGWASCWSG